jgi:hypothetical protein
MSDWINEEFERFEKERAEDIEHFEKERAEQKRNNDFTKFTDCLTALRVQIEKDVSDINTNKVGKKILGGYPIRITPIFCGYEIRQFLYPTHTITVLNKGQQIELKRATFVEPQNKKNQYFIETLDVRIDDESVYLVKQGMSNRGYLIPEQASRYILTPLLDSVKEVVKENKK